MAAFNENNYRVASCICKDNFSRK